MVFAPTTISPPIHGFSLWTFFGRIVCSFLFFVNGIEIFVRDPEFVLMNVFFWVALGFVEFDREVHRTPLISIKNGIRRDRVDLGLASLCYGSLSDELDELGKRVF